MSSACLPILQPILDFRGRFSRGSGACGSVIACVLPLALLLCGETRAAPGDILFQERFNNNGDYNSDWQGDTSFGSIQIDGGVFGSPSNSLRFNGWMATITSRTNRIDAQVPAAVLTAWIRRRGDSGADLTFEYLSSGNTWVELATYTGSGAQGQIFTPTFTLPADALHGQLRLRFRVDGYSSSGWNIDDIVITETESGSTCDTYRDQFNGVSYTNSDGTLDWSGNAWVERDSGGGGPGGGLAFISGGELNLRGNNTTNNTRVTRQANTAGASRVTLSFDFSIQGVIESDDAVLIQVSGNGGGSFTTLETITGLTGSPSGSRHYDISAYAAATLRVRIAIAGDLNNDDCCYGSNETFQIEDLTIETCEASPPLAPLGEWRLEALNWNGGAGEVRDASGNDLHGAAVAVGGQYPTSSGAQPAIAGDPGTCRYGVFNGAGDGYLRIDDNALLDITEELTVSAWIYPTALGGLRTIVSKDENWEFHVDGARQIYWWWGGGGNQLTSSGAPIATGDWYHIAVTYRDGLQKIYIDGVERASGDDGGDLPVNNDPLLIGADLGFTERNFAGYIDEVRVYDRYLSQAEVQAVMDATHPCPSGPAFDHFSIDIGAGAASTCVPLEVTLTAEDGGGAKIENYEGSLSLSVSSDHGRWQKTAAAGDALGDLTTSGADDGAATYQFSSLDEGDITLALDNSHAETLTVTATEIDSGLSFVSAPATFRENAFVVTVPDSLSTDIVAGRGHRFHIEMVRRDAVTGDCGPAVDYGTASIKAWMSRDGADPGGAAPALETASETQTLPPFEPWFTNLTLPFSAGGADFTLHTTDVGKYALNFKDDSGDFSDEDIEGGTGALVVRPFGFDIQVAGNPGAVDASGTAFTVAGNNFSVTARAVLWSETDDGDDNGVADGHGDRDPDNNTDLSDNAGAVSFGGENPPESLRLNAYLARPAGGADPGLGDGDGDPGADARLLENFSGGVDGTAQVFFAEVGIVELEALVGDEDYLGAGSSVTARARGVSGPVGRFTPDRLVLLENDPVGGGTVQSRIDPACGGFSYLEQSLSATWYLAAVNAGGDVTTNYRDSFAKLTGADSYNFGARDELTGTDLSARLSHEGTNVTWGVDLFGTGVTYHGYGRLVSGFSIGRAAAVDGPYTGVKVGVIPTDNEDGTTIVAADFDLDTDGDGGGDHALIDETSTRLRFGRLRLADAFGPETADLPVTFVTEYWDGGAFGLNGDDSCTAIATSAVSYPGGSIDDPANRTVPVGGGGSTGIYSMISGGEIRFTGGDAGHRFTAPGAGNTGSFSVDVDLALYPWLRHDWDQDGDFFDSTLPPATYTFGSYRGHDRIIYWREQF